MSEPAVEVVRGRRPGIGFARVKQQDELQFDGKSASEVYHQSFLSAVDTSLSIGRRLRYLNYIVKTVRQSGPPESYGLPFDQLIPCFCAALGDQSKDIRAATYRVVRYLVLTAGYCDDLLKSRVDYFIARSLDLAFESETESLEALRLTRKLIEYGRISSPILSALMAAALQKAEEKERLGKASIETLCEILILCRNVPHLDLLAIVRCLMDFISTSTSLSQSRAVVAALLHFAGKARLRDTNSVMYCDICRILCALTTMEGYSDSERREDQALKQQLVWAAQCGVVAAYRTWEGLFLLTSSGKRGIQSLVQVLFLSNAAAQIPVLETISRLLFLPLKPSSSRKVTDACSLSENFTAAEAMLFLPPVGRTRIDLCDNYLAVLLFVLHQCGLVEGLISVIKSTSKDDCRRMAVMILAAFLNYVNALLPAEFNAQIQSLPELIQLDAHPEIQFDVVRILDAEAHSTLPGGSCRRASVLGLAPMSSFLRHILEINDPKAFVSSFEIQKDFDSKAVADLLQDSLVLLTNDAGVWNWNAVHMILSSKILQPSWQETTKFYHRLMVFFKPSNKNFSMIPRKHEKASLMSICGGEFFMNVLAGRMDILEELLEDLHQCLSNVLNGAALDRIFNPVQLNSCCASEYFVFIGKLSSVAAGITLLSRYAIFPVLGKIVSQCDIHSGIVKLIISTLDYKDFEGPAGAIFKQVLSCSNPELRLYATLHLRTLLRAGFPYFDTWCIPLLIQRMEEDDRKSVSMAAASILDEACDLQRNLLALCCHLDKLIDKDDDWSALLTAKIMGNKDCFLKASEKAVRFVSKWKEGFCERYVSIVEELVNTSLYPMNMDGNADFESADAQKPEILLSEHLYGQLVQHEDGCDLIRQLMPDIVASLRMCTPPVSADLPIVRIKAALWAVGHIGRTIEGLSILNEFGVIDDIVQLAMNFPVVSVRGTAFFVLGMWSVTERGADLLKSRDWLAVRHDRSRNYSFVDQRVQYTWRKVYDGSGAPAWIDGPLGTESLSPGIGSGGSSKPLRMISFTMSPPGVEPSSRKISAANTFSIDAPWGDAGSKDHRGESGFESSDGILSHSYADFEPLSLPRREDRSDSTRTASEYSVGSGSLSVGSPNDTTLINVIGTSPDAPKSSASSRKIVPFIRRQASAIFPSMSSTKQKSKGRAISVLEGEEAMTRSTSEHEGILRRKGSKRGSFRFLKETFRTGRSKQKEDIASMTHSPAPVSVIQSDPNLVRSGSPENENAMKEESFLGIALPVKRYIWPMEISGHPVLVEPILLGRSTSRNTDPLIPETVTGGNGLEQHMPEKCVACSIMGKDLSSAPNGDSSLRPKRREVIRFVKILATPLGHRSSEQGLLSLKAQLPDSFRDCCLWTEVTLLLASYSFKLQHRRLIQELFADVPFQQTVLARVREDLRKMSSTCIDGSVERTAVIVEQNSLST